MATASVSDLGYRQSIGSEEWKSTDLQKVLEALQKQQASKGTTVATSTKNTSGVGTSFIKSVSPYATSTTNNSKVLTTEQNDLLQQLYGYAKTGNYGDIYQAGKGYTEPTGYYFLGEGEKEAKSALEDMMANGLPESFQLAKEEFGNILGQDSYDPYNEKGSFKGFKTDVQDEMAESSDVLKRNLAVQGDLYSTRLIQEQGNLAEVGQKALTSELGRLYDEYTGRRLEAASGAANIGKLEELMNLGRIQKQQEIGELQRQLEDQKLRDQYAEWQRSRAEVDDVLKKAENIFNANYKSSGSSSSGGGGSSSSGSSSSDDTGYSMVHGQKIKNPDWSNQESIDEYNKQKKKIQDNLNPYGLWTYDGSSTGAVWGRKLDSRATGWVFKG